jgi:hypothetical protein
VRHIPFNTLAHYERMPQCQLINVAKVNCNLFATNIQKYRCTVSGHSMVSPDSEAIQFYLFNHLVSLVKERFTSNEPLPEWAIEVMQQYKKIVMEQGARLTSYMALICARESRHMGSMDNPWWNKHIIDLYGEKCKKFHYLIRGGGSDTAVLKFTENAPAIPVGYFFKAIEVMFFNGHFGSSFGGMQWGNIAKTLNQFLYGNITQEMMIDTSYTLAHNNGPMFNKGMLYTIYSPEFRYLLDTQRSGQMPEHIIEYGGAGLSSSQLSTFKTVCAVMPNKFGSYVDWYKVKSLGAIADCTLKIVQQNKKYGKSNKTVVKVGGKFTEPIGEFQVSPLVSLPIIERVD